MNLLKKIILFFLVLLQAGKVATADDQTGLAGLSEEVTWLKLLHYQSDLGSPSGWSSAIHTDEFFLSEKGHEDPLLELAATIKAFNQQEQAEVDSDPKCRFPARYRWLLEKGVLNKEASTEINCPAYKEWTRSGTVGSISIVFATGYLGNPASYYGHTLLKFNFKDQEEHTRLLDVSVNYGVIDSQNDNAISYIFKSVAGGYDGGFSHINFYYHNHNYGDLELRDLWEYKLDLPSEDVDMIVAHAWEVLGKRYTYHFFRENCAFRMAELLQVIDGLDVVPSKWPWLIPQALIEEIGVTNYLNKPLLAQVNYLPSRQSRFYARYRDLNKEEGALMPLVIKDSSEYQSDAFNRLSLESKQRVIDALIDYYQFIGAPMDLASSEIKSAYHKALEQRYKLPPGETVASEYEPMAPHSTRALGLISAGINQTSLGANIFSLRIRPAYYDALDSEGGQVKNSMLVMGDTTIGVRGGVFLSKLDIVGVESANPGVTGLPGDTNSAWKVHLGIEQQKPNDSSSLVGRLQGDKGWGMSLSNSLYGAFYVGGALQNNKNGYGFGYAKASIDFIYRPTDALGLIISHEQRQVFKTKIGRYGLTSIKGRFAFSKDRDIRLNYQRDDIDQYGLSLGWYW